MKNKIDFKKGNGTLLFGTSIMILTLTIVFVIVQTFLIKTHAYDTQTTADSIADGTAVFMANEGGEYEDAVRKADEIKKVIHQEIGIDGNGLAIDKNAFNEDMIQASITTDYQYLRKYQDKTQYSIRKTGTTEFQAYGSDYVSWMVGVASDESVGYSQPHRYYLDNSNPDIHDVDCSSFVYYALKNNGYTPEQIGNSPFTTATMPAILPQCGFHPIPYMVAAGIGGASLKEGDILWRAGHTEVYIGNGQTVGAHHDENHGISGSTPGDGDGTEVNVSRNSQSWTLIYRR